MRSSLLMSEEQQNIKLKCSNCEHYKRVEVAGKRMVLQCTKPEAFKEDEGATKVGYINANIARRFAKHCGQDAIHFLEKIADPEPEPTESLSWKPFAKVLFGSSDKEIIVGCLTKALIVLVVTVIILLSLIKVMP